MVFRYILSKKYVGRNDVYMSMHRVAGVEYSEPPANRKSLSLFLRESIGPFKFLSIGYCIVTR